MKSEKSSSKKITIGTLKKVLGKMVAPENKLYLWSVWTIMIRPAAVLRILVCVVYTVLTV